MIKTIIFDLGGVLINWDPRNMYRKIFSDEEEMEYFLANVCTMAWNEEQDGGRTWEEAINLLTPQFPKYKSEIAAYRERWVEMLDGSIQGTVDILKQLKASKQYRIYALTNWSGETFPTALELFDFLQLFEGILVSGDENLKKPDPKIYQLILDRYNIEAGEAVFIDDSARNVKAAKEMGIASIQFESPEALKTALKEYGISI